MNQPLPFIDPTAGGSRIKIAAAPRPASLAGKVVALLDNSKEQADVILETVAAALRERYGVSDVVLARKPYYSKPAEPAVINELAGKAQVAIAALGG